MSTAQVVIVGGGVMGVSLAYHLAGSGWQDVVLLEKNDLTHGSTWHAAGLCTHFAHNPTIQQLRARSVRLYRDILPAETGRDCGFHASGAMRITRNPDRMDEFAHVAGLSAFNGYKLEILTRDRIAALHPMARLDGLLGGIYEPDDGHVDPTLATNAMAEIARRRGATISRHCAVKGIRRAGDLWLVETGAGPIRARHLVNAAGTWGWEIGAMMGVNVPSVPVLHQYLVTATIGDVAARQAAGQPELPIIRDPEESWYVRQERDGLILGPYEKAARVWSVDGVPGSFGAELLPPDLDRVEPIIEAAMARIPALESVGIKSVVNGPITFTPDANPLIGPAAGVANAWLLTGSSMGVMEGGGAGWFLAHWMTTGAPPMDALAVDPRRFGAWADRDYRVEKAVECFGLQFGVHYPHEERPAARGRRLSPLHGAMSQGGAVMGAAHGWERPNWFSHRAGATATPSFRRSNWFAAVAREVETLATRAGLADLSAFSKFDITGPDTRACLDALGANAVPAVGRIGLTHALTPAGGVAAEFTVSMIGPQHAYLTSAAAAEDMDLDLLRDRADGFDVTVRNVTQRFGALGLMGPRAGAILADCADTGFDRAFPWLSVREVEIAGRRLRALRLSYVGEQGWELHGAASDMRAVFDAVAEAGRPHGMGVYGAYAANSMRLEKSYRAWGGDLTTERTPAESGLSAFVKPEGRDFVGKAAMLRRDADPARWRMVLLSPDSGDCDPFHGHPVLCGDRVVGIVTSGAFGHRVGRALALAFLREPCLTENLSVEILGRPVPATVLPAAPYDPANTRMKH